LQTSGEDTASEEADNINDIPPPPDIRRPDGAPIEEVASEEDKSKDEEKPAE